jgi:hypothetical protein
MSGFTPSTVLLAGTSEPLLIAVIGLLALVILGLVALALLLRRRNRTQTAVSAPPSRPPAFVPSAQTPLMPRKRPVQAVRGGGVSGGLAIATSSAMVCPTCRTEYHGMIYCTGDARRLVPPEEMLSGPGLGPMRALSRSAGLVCMACRRAYEPGLRSCPHDGNELVPFPVYNATRPRRARTTEQSGVIARICPVCGAKYDLNARFCGHDAGQLVVIN